MENQKRNELLMELKDLLLSGLVEKLKSGNARGADYANAIKLLKEYRELEDGAATPGHPALDAAFYADVPFPVKKEDAPFPAVKEEDVYPGGKGTGTPLESVNRMNQPFDSEQH